MGGLSGTLTSPEVVEPVPKKERRFSPGEKFGDRYTIIEEVGRGGMGTAYKAEDEELGTVVVLKMIRPELASRPDIVERFKKEILLGRTVTHENVIRIHDLGEVDKVKYISMDYIKGENLSELIHTSGTLSPATCLSITRQIARALEAAHQKGIIHQDLKPSNVMIDNSGRVFVADFGLARSIVAPREFPERRLVGTPRYFSPEQARGEPLDQRSDIYSLGIVMYEMVTGAPPFDADSVEGYIHKHIAQEPRPPSQVNRALPHSLERIILKCLKKKKGERYQTSVELLADLEAQTKSGEIPFPELRSRKWPWAVAGAAAILAIALWLVNRPSPPRSSPAPGHSIAVMYAVNNSGDKSLDALLRWGITSLLTTNLAVSKYLRIFPEDRLMQMLENMNQLKEEQHLAKTLDRIADEGNIGYFVLPSFTKAGASLRIDIKVRRARAKEILDAASVQGMTEDLWSMVDELGLKVKAALNLSETEMADDYSQRLGQITTDSLEALRYYVEGEQFLARGDFQASIQSLEKATEIDPDYALAYRALAENHVYLGDHDRLIKYLRKALALVNRVSDRDRILILGFAAMVLDDSPLPAAKSLGELTERNPQDEEAYAYLGAIYRNLEEWDVAIEQYKKILEINERSMVSYDNLAFIYTSQGQYEKALDVIRTGRKIFPNEPRLFLRPSLMISIIQGRYDEAASALRRALSLAPDEPDYSALEGHIFLLRGDLASAGTTYGRIQQKEEADVENPGFLGRLWLAHLHLQRGEYGQSQEGILSGIQMAQKSRRIYDELEYRLLYIYSELQLGRFTGAIEAVKPVLEICRNISAKSAPKFALLMSGIAYLSMGQIEEARKVGDRLRQLILAGGCSKDMRYYEFLNGEVSLAEKDPAQAVRYFEQAISRLPAQREDSDQHAFYYDRLAAACYQGNDYAKARDAYERIISLTTGRLRWGDIYTRAFYWQGKTNQKMGNGEAAAACYEKFLKLWENADPERPEVADAAAQLALLRRTS